MNRLFIVDPSLKDLRGHHYNLTQAITASAQQLGFAVTWLCSAEFDSTCKIDGINCDPVFRSSMYQQYMMQKNGRKKRGSFLSRFFRKQSDAKSDQLDQEQQFIDDMRLSFARLGVSDQDRILIHTADGITYRALARLFSGHDQKALPRFHVATPYNPTGIMPNKGDVATIDAAITALRVAKVIDSQLFLYGENEPLANHLATHWGVPVRPLDLPVSAPTTANIDQGQSYRRETLKLDEDDFLVISLGSARLEKGFDVLPAIVGELAKMLDQVNVDKLNHPKIKFVFHASPQIIGRHPKISEAIDALELMSRDLVELILAPLSEEEYSQLLFASNAVIMPYTEKDYAVRGSMIVSEAIVAGKIIIATKGTFPGLAASEMQGLTASNPAEFAKAILTIAADKEKFTQPLEQARATFLERNSVARYWQKCLDAEMAGA